MSSPYSVDSIVASCRVGATMDNPTGRQAMGLDMARCKSKSDDWVCGMDGLGEDFRSERESADSVQHLTDRSGVKKIIRHLIQAVQARRKRV